MRSIRIREYEGMRADTSARLMTSLARHNLQDSFNDCFVFTAFMHRHCLCLRCISHDAAQPEILVHASEPTGRGARTRRANDMREETDLRVGAGLGSATWSGWSCQAAAA